MNSSQQNTQWQPKLQSFLKTNGKGVINNLKSKAILVEMNGEDCFVIDRDNVQQYMNDNNIKSVSDQFLSFVNTSDSKTKVMYKQASDMENTNLIVFRKMEDEIDRESPVSKQRNKLFIIDDIQMQMLQNPDIVNNQIRRTLFPLKSKDQHRYAAQIASLFLENDLPIATIILFQDRSDVLEKVSNALQTKLAPSFQVQQGGGYNSLEDIQRLVIELKKATPESQCNIYKKHNITHNMLIDLHQIICNMDMLMANNQAKQDLSNTILAYLKLDTNNPNLFIKNECSDRCSAISQKLTEFLDDISKPNQ